MENITTIRRSIESEREMVERYLGSTPAKRAQMYRVSQAVFADMSVQLGGGMTPYLLTGQEDFAKGQYNTAEAGYFQMVQYMSAHKSSGIANLCPWATPECIEGCLQNNGHLGMDNGQTAMLVRTHFFVTATGHYLVVLLHEIAKHAKKISKMGKTMVLRLNGTSDYRWEWHGWLIEAFYTLGVGEMFDYTKGHHRQSTPHYYLAKSVTEKQAPADVTPGSVVVVNVEKGQDMPKTWHGHPVIDGDREHGDFRFLDRKNPEAVTFLRWKGGLRKAPVGDKHFVKNVLTS